MNRRTRIDRADFYSGLATLVIGLFALVESLRMPRLEHLNINPYTVPGLVPGLLGAILTVLGLVLLLRGLKGPRVPADPAPLADPADPAAQSADHAQTGHWLTDSWKRVFLALGTTIGYAGFLFGQVPFVIATTIFVFTFTVGAEWLNRTRPRSLAKTAAWALLLALGMAFAVQYIFVELFRVRLPG